MKALEMIRSLETPLPPLSLPEGYTMISVNEDNGHLWEEVMDAAFGSYNPGDFRYVLVSNNGYEEDRVFVLLDESGRAVATASPWDYGTGNWHAETFPFVNFVGVIPSCQGRGLGKLMTLHSLHELKARGYQKACLNIKGTEDGGENLPAAATYVSCGFTPCIADKGHAQAWEKIYARLSLPCPAMIEMSPCHQTIGMPHPPRPWPYQVRCAAEAQQAGELYIFGQWAEHNLYQVDSERYIQLKQLIAQSDAAPEIIRLILKKQVKHIYIDRPRNPQALLLVNRKGAKNRVGKSGDGRFERGTEKL